MKAGASERNYEWGGGPPMRLEWEDGTGEGEGEMLLILQQGAIRLA